jgi:hypothetical protein
MRKMHLAAAALTIAVVMVNASSLYSDSEAPPTPPFASFPTTQASAADQARWQLSVARVKGDQRPVNLEINLKNVASTTMKFPRLLSEIQGSQSFILRIRRADGSLLPLTLLGHQLYEPDPRLPQRFEFNGADLNAGQSFSAILPADRIFDLSMDGVYYVTAWTFVWHLGANYCVPIKSNELVVTLQPGLSKSR